MRKIVYISPDKHKRLLLHVNSLGYHEVYVNGKKAGSAVLAPAVAQLNKRSLTVTYDITPMVRKGNNEIRLWLGKGWYRRNLGFAQYDGPLVRADLVEVLPGTMKHLCCTDASWKATASGYHDTGTWQALQFGGERVDGRILTAAQHAWMPVAEIVHTLNAWAMEEMEIRQHLPCKPFVMWLQPIIIGCKHGPILWAKMATCLMWPPQEVVVAVLIGARLW